MCFPQLMATLPPHHVGCALWTRVSDTARRLGLPNASQVPFSQVTFSSHVNLTSKATVNNDLNLPQGTTPARNDCDSDGPQAGTVPADAGAA